MGGECVCPVGGFSVSRRGVARRPAGWTAGDRPGARRWRYRACFARMRSPHACGVPQRHPHRRRNAPGPASRRGSLGGRIGPDSGTGRAAEHGTAAPLETGAPGAGAAGREAAPGHASRPARDPSPSKIACRWPVLPASMIIRVAGSRSSRRGQDQRFHCRSGRCGHARPGCRDGLGTDSLHGESAGQSHAGRRRRGEARRDPVS